MDDTLIPRIPLFAGATTPAHLLAFHARCFRALVHAFPHVGERVRGGLRRAQLDLIT